MKQIVSAVFLIACLIAPTPAFAGGAPAAGDGHGGESESEGGGRTHRPLTTADTYIYLDALTASVHYNFSLRGIMNIEAGLDIPDRQLRERAERLMPRLRDRYISALALYTGSNYRYGDVPDADRISELLQAATNEALGQEGAEFLLGMVIIHDN